MICKVCNEEVNEFSILDPFGIYNHTLCNKCFNKFNIIYENSLVNKIKCLSLYEYNGLIKDLIFDFKGLYDYELKDIFLEYFLDDLKLKYYGYTITFAPSSDEDNLKRGFNHVEEMFSSLPNKKTKLFIKKDNYKQSENKYKDRKNIIDHIALIKENVKGLKRILIVDDVLTSGNTLLVCASLLYKEGIKEIEFLTISKVVEFNKNNVVKKQVFNNKFDL